MFKVGDKVKRIGNSSINLIKGEIYEVEVLSNNGWLYLKGFRQLAYNPQMFVLFEENVVMPEQVKKVPHKHAEIIKAWADGAKVQFRNDPGEKWEDITRGAPHWFEPYEYRVKPEKVERWVIVNQHLDGSWHVSGDYATEESAKASMKIHYLPEGKPFVHKIEFEV